ncbi:hypothetical protein BS78_K062300 [Paspalum vaginatum]|uniref:Myb/SANT-like domain-containing protein n=1 Tax=Paspalum vaginatum TaxID=158149 RepID=A0A9W8CD81_9POAL|nr:hypothetical protein BS78_K062300 [Paspalum vaginatum]
MTTQGYKNIAAKYLQKTGLHHSRTQLKNKWDLLKGLYGFWLDPSTGTVDSSDEHWKKITEGHSDWKKLRYGPPENEHLMKEMFATIVVDGSTSCVPGEGASTEGFVGEEAYEVYAEDMHHPM